MALPGTLTEVARAQQRTREQYIPSLSVTVFLIGKCGVVCVCENIEEIGRSCRKEGERQSPFTLTPTANQ